MKRNWPISFIIFMIICQSCTSLKALEYKTYHNFAFTNVGFNSSSIRLDLEYYNPNNFGLQLKNSDLDIYIDGNKFGHSLSDSLITIPKRAIFILPVKFDIDMQNLFKNVLKTVAGKEVTIKLTGKLRIGKGNVFMSLPLSYETKETFSLF